MAKYYCGDGIRHYRKLNDIKQESLAHAVNLRRQTISDMERNKSTVEEDLLTHIAKELGTTPDKIKQHKNGMVINMHNQQVDVDQYNNCVLQVPVAVMEALQHSLKACNEALQLAHTQIADLNSRLARTERNGD